MEVLQLSKEERTITGKINLTGSKSISNRALIIRALCQDTFPIEGLAKAKDTDTMQQLLASSAEELDTGAAGTTFRFMTAFLAATEQEERVLTGSERMKQRPIGVLVDALRSIGANIQYVEKEGYPPLLIKKAAHFGETGKLSISAGTSSQYISALLMLAPTLPNGLELELTGKIVSRPYIRMTLQMMKYFGVNYTWEDQIIKIAPQQYTARPFRVEADWSGASYYFSLAAIADTCDLYLDGLFNDSVQGDSVLPTIYEHFGVKTTFTETGVHLSKIEDFTPPPILEYDFLECPDLAQTVAVSCAAVGMQGLFTGLDTLRIKETDRIAALQAELGKVGAYVSELPARFSSKSPQNFYMVEGQAKWDTAPSFATYEDHRMAMAFAPLAMLHPIQIEEPNVVEKSYPDFWKDFGVLGFMVS